MTDTAGSTPSEALELDGGELTMGDLEDIETALGFPMSEAAERPGGTTRLARAMVWIRHRRIDPAYTFEDTAQVPVSQMTAMADLLGGDALPPPPALSTA